MKQWIVLFATLGLIACSDKDEDSKPKAEVQHQPVLGQATKPGVFPDGSTAQPLTAQEKQSMQKMTEGVVAVNKGVGNLNSKVVSQTTNRSQVRLEAFQAVLNQPLFQKLIRDPKQLFLDLQARASAGEFENDLRFCTINSNHSQPVQTGDENNFLMSWDYWQSVLGSSCPVSSRIEFKFTATGQKVGDKGAKMSGRLNLTQNNSVVQASGYQEVFDFVSQNTKGSMWGELAINDQSVEMAASMDVSGDLKTLTQGSLDAQILMDLSAAGTMPQQQQSSGAPSKPENQFQLSQAKFGLVVVLNTTNYGKMLLQVFATGSGSQTQVKVYVNGEEIQIQNVSSGQVISESSQQKQ